MALPFKPDTAVLYDISDEGATEIAETPYDGASVAITGMGYPVTPEQAVRSYGIEVTVQYEFLCDIHASDLNTPLGGTFPVRDGQRFIWNSREYIVSAPPVEYRHRLGADHLAIPLMADPL